eukprot:TRINITY_DN381_c0_g1_i4.p1 TRINITY_DN381_c0_g1~~TRINITY_DN381_c0_g1_i4.p1  ORF type:complete len:250 (-),score=19.31 TRINITY_DN381_c0_g1_i4:8-757(-)
MAWSLHSRRDDIHTYVCMDMISIVTSVHFWANLQLLEEIIRPIQCAITETQADGPISNIWKIWADLEAFFDPIKPSTMSVVLRQKIVESLNKRWELFSTRIHISSFMLDPRFRHIPSSTKDNESEAHFQSAEEFIRKYDFNADKWAAGLQQAWIDFRLEEGVFSNQCQVTDDPVIWWKRIRAMSTRNKWLSDIAIEILSFPGSAAAVERTFSVVRRIHTWQRNRLRRETLQKLVYIYINRRALNKSLIE